MDERPLVAGMAFAVRALNVKLNPAWVLLTRTVCSAVLPRRAGDG
jgi:hypothetical protein